MVVLLAVLAEAEALAKFHRMAVLSKETIGDSEWQKIVVSGGPTSTGGTDEAGDVDPRPVSVCLSAPLANISAGDIINGSCEVRVDAGATGLRGVSLYLAISTASGTRLYAAGEPDLARSQINLDCPPVEWSGVLRVHPTDPVGNVTGAQLIVAITGANYSSTALSLSATVRVRAAKAFKNRS